MTRTLICLLLAAGLLAGCRDKGEGEGKRPAAGAGAPAVEAGGTPHELQYSPEGFPLGLSVSQGVALQLFETPSDSQGFRKLPPDGGGKRYYDEFTIAGQKHLVLTEEGKPPRFWFDENRNGDLTDDRGPFTAEKESFLPNHLSVQIRYDREKVIVPYRMWLFSSNMGGVRYYPVCHWQGSLALDGRMYNMVAFDGNADGDYSNDPLVIDANGNGKAEEDEKLMPGQTITLEGKTVKLHGVSPSGLTVRLSW